MEEKDIIKSVRKGELLGDFLAQRELNEQQIAEVDKLQSENRAFLDEITEGSFIAERHQFYHSIDAEKEFASFNKKRRKKSLLYFSQFAIPAAAVILMGLFIWQNSTPDNIATPNPALLAKSEILPGTSKAILVLEDNRQIDLSDRKQEISEQNGYTAHSENDELSYSGMDAGNEKTETPRHRLITPIGGEYKLTLSDGTKVWINAGSELSYPVAFNTKIREVLLSGEAYFEVAKDSERPFCVKVEKLDILVTGTAFNISAYREEKKASITLVHGGINVNTGDKLLSKLTPGKQLNYNYQTDSYHLENADIESIVAWKNGLFLFKDEPLESIAQKLGRWYNVEFILQPGLSGKYYSGMIERDEKIDATLNILRLTNEIDFRIKENHCIEILPIQ